MASRKERAAQRAADDSTSGYVPLLGMVILLAIIVAVLSLIF